MFTKKFFSALCMLAVLTASSFSLIYAQSNTSLIQAYINNQNIDLFLSGDFNSEDLNLKVANKNAEIIDSGLISEKEISVRTAVLVDISASMPIECRDTVHELIENRIKNLEKNEEMKIIAFGAETNVLRDFTSDRYDLSNAAAEIEFNGTQSALYDTVFNTLPEINSYDDEPCFFRTVVITDGADFTPGGITKEELFMRLQAETYPIDVICVSANIPQVRDKDLAALTRISGGRYFDLYPEADVYEIADGLSVSDYFWIRAQVPAELLDGSTRQIDVSDGISAVSFDMKMSVFDEQSEELTDTSDITENTERFEDASSEHTLTDFISNNAAAIAAASGAVLIIAVIIIIIAVKKKKSDLPRLDSPPQNTGYNNSGTNETNTATELYTEVISDERFSVKISQLGNFGESRVVDISSDVLIGRGKNCVFKIEDKSVSREQCKIVVRNSGLVVINLSKSNVTKLNGITVTKEELLHPGDNLKLGRVTLRIDYIQRIGSMAEKKTDTEMMLSDDTFENSGGGYTESIFK